MLAVECLETNEMWIGNADAQSGYATPPGGFDNSNATQVVRIDDPSPGVYLVTVTAMGEIIDPPQPFALAVTGDFLTRLTVQGP